MVILGIDVGKRYFYCALLGADGKINRNSFPNSQIGFTKLLKWLRNRRVDRVHACMEATGGWSDALATFLHEHGHIVSVENALKIKAFAQTRLSRTKTDKADAELIADYCTRMQPPPWTPPSAKTRRIRQLSRRRQALVEMVTQENNRLQSPEVDATRQSIESTIAFLKEQIVKIERELASEIDDDPTLRGQSELLQSIPGIGERTATTLLSELPDLADFRSPKALAAFVGLCPRLRYSGTSVCASWLSRAGNAAVRSALFYPAMTAMVYNPPLKLWSAQLRSRGKTAKQVIAATMRRLLVIAWGVLRSGRPFEVKTA